MSTIRKWSFKCGVCGASGSGRALASSTEGGSPDTDLRPGEPLGSTLPFRVHWCSACGYCSTAIEAPATTPTVREILAGQRYRQELGVPTATTFARLLGGVKEPTAAAMYRCVGVISEEMGALPAAGRAYLKAAWCLDDGRHADLAKAARLDTARVWEAALAQGSKVFADPETEYLVLADVLRRAGEFGRAAVACRKAAIMMTQFSAYLPSLAFQEALVESRDVGQHNWGEIG